jgi:hypothetical protein
MTKAGQSEKASARPISRKWLPGAMDLLRLIERQLGSSCLLISPETAARGWPIYQPQFGNLCQLFASTGNESEMVFWPVKAKFNKMLTPDSGIKFGTTLATWQATQTPPG